MRAFSLKNPTMRRVFANLRSFLNTDDGGAERARRRHKDLPEGPDTQLPITRRNKRTKKRCISDADRLITYINIALISLTETKLCLGGVERMYLHR